MKSMSALRQHAARLALEIREGQRGHLHGGGSGYQIYEPNNRDNILWGAYYELNLAEVEAYLDDYEARAKADGWL